MRSSITPTGVLLRLIVFTGLIAVLLAGIVVAIQRPVSGNTHDVEALFTDASGLRTNDDVRMFGVAVGKVVSIDLEGNLARVKTRLSKQRPSATENDNDQTFAT
jgi:phospholipid/cholesterol/gamma-HCH transport system substrate-binding protein